MDFQVAQKCPKCENAVSEKDLFCQSCGEVLPAALYGVSLSPDQMETVRKKARPLDDLHKHNVLLQLVKIFFVFLMFESLLIASQHSLFWLVDIYPYQISLDWMIIASFAVMAALTVIARKKNGRFAGVTEMRQMTLLLCVFRFRSFWSESSYVAGYIRFRRLSDFVNILTKYPTFACALAIMLVTLALILFEKKSNEVSVKLRIFWSIPTFIGIGLVLFAVCTGNGFMGYSIWFTSASRIPLFVLMLSSLLLGTIVAIVLHRVSLSDAFCAKAESWLLFSISLFLESQMTAWTCIPGVLTIITVLLQGALIGWYICHA